MEEPPTELHPSLSSETSEKAGTSQQQTEENLETKSVDDAEREEILAFWAKISSSPSKGVLDNPVPTIQPKKAVQSLPRPDDNESKNVNHINDTNHHMNDGSAEIIGDQAASPSVASRRIFARQDTSSGQHELKQDDTPRAVVVTLSNDRMDTIELQPIFTEEV